MSIDWDGVKFFLKDDDGWDDIFTTKGFAVGEPKPTSDLTINDINVYVKAMKTSLDKPMTPEEIFKLKYESWTVQKGDGEIIYYGKAKKNADFNTYTAQKEFGISKEVYTTHNFAMNSYAIEMKFYKPNNHPAKYIVNVSTEMAFDMDKPAMAYMLIEKFAKGLSDYADIDIEDAWYALKGHQTFYNLLSPKTISTITAGDIIGTVGNYSIGSGGTDASVLSKKLPGMNTPVNCPHCSNSNKMTLWRLVQHLNDDADWSRDKIADWLDEQHDAGIINIEFEKWNEDPDSIEGQEIAGGWVDEIEDFANDGVKVTTIAEEMTMDEINKFIENIDFSNMALGKAKKVEKILTDLQDKKGNLIENVNKLIKEVNG